MLRTYFTGTVINQIRQVPMTLGTHCPLVRVICRFWIFEIFYWLQAFQAWTYNGKDIPVPLQKLLTDLLETLLCLFLFSLSLGAK